MYDIGSDKDSADCTVKIIHHVKRTLCLRVAALSGGLNLAVRRGRDRRLRDGKIHGAKQQQYGYYPRQSTAIIHCWISNSFFIKLTHSVAYTPVCVNITLDRQGRGTS